MTWSIRTAEPGYYPDLGHLWLDSFWASRYAKRFAVEPEYVEPRVVVGYEKELPRDSTGRFLEGDMVFSLDRHGKRIPIFQRNPRHGKGAYFRQHRPVVLDIMRRAETRIVYDPEAPEVFWAFAVTEGETVHYVFAKRRFHREEQSADMFRALLGDRLTKPAVYSHELVEFRRPEIVKAGLVVPANWVLDEYSAFPIRSAA